jgi:uncharacterized Zn finger protein
MPREDAATKARRLLGEGRVTIRTLEQDLIVARVRGDSAREHEVTWEPSGWACPCDALSRLCSHTQAVMLVVLEPTPSAQDRRSETPAKREVAVR